MQFHFQGKPNSGKEQIRSGDIEFSLQQMNQSVITSAHYNRGCFFTRNRYMVDKADAVVCAFNGKSGGTAYTVDYALKQNKIVIQIDPETSSVSMLSKRNFESI